jgi:hypothetical protein
MLQREEPDDESGANKGPNRVTSAAKQEDDHNDDEDQAERAATDPDIVGENWGK